MSAQKSSTAAGHRGRIGIFFWDGWLSVAPSVINAARELAEHSYDVDLYVRKPAEESYPAAPSFPNSVTIHWYATHRVPASAAAIPVGTSRRLLTANRISRHAARHVEFVRFVRWAVRAAKEVESDFLIGIDAHGLIAAAAAARSRQIPTIYWCLELPSGRRRRDPVEELIRKLEGRLYRRAAFAIVPDEMRAESLQRVHGKAPAPTIIVPNAPRGPGPEGRAILLQQRLALSAADIVVLHAGMIAPAVLSLELAAAARSWPSDWILIFHERIRRSPADPYLQAVARAGGPHVRLSLDPVEYDELDQVFSSADIGLAFYDLKLGDNFGLMAGASGKAAHYLRCGLPVLCLAESGLSEVVSRYNCGRAVKSPAVVAAAIREILDDYDALSANARACYAEVFEFGKHFQPVLAFLDSHLKNAPLIPRAAP